MKFGWRQCLGWFAGNRAMPLLGVDLAAAGISIVELSRLNEGWRVEHFSRRALPSGAIREGSIVNADQVADVLSEALRECGSHTRHAALALPSGLVIKKMLSFPNDLSDDELALQVDTDAAQNLPFALDELSLDFSIIGPSLTMPESVDVMLVAARREKIAERLTLAQSVGLEPVIVDVESQALMAAVAVHAAQQEEQASGCSALLQVGRDVSQFSVFSKKALIFERELSVGLHKLEQASHRYPEQALAALEAFHALVCQEIRRAQQLYATTAEQTEIGRIFIAGPAEKLARLPEAMLERLKIKALFANPFAGMANSAAVDRQALHAEASACLIACGLAMCRVTS